jgi:GH24 family phage-related lysozyme (muramidase)
LSGIKDILTDVKNLITGIKLSDLFKIGATGGIAGIVTSILGILKSPVVLTALAVILPSLYALMKAREGSKAGVPDDAPRKQQLSSNQTAIMESKNVRISGVWADGKNTQKSAFDLIQEEQNLNQLVSKNPKMLDEKAKKLSAMRINALASEGFYPLGDYTPGKNEELLFRREVKEPNMLDLPDTKPEASPAVAAANDPREPIGNTPTKVGEVSENLVNFVKEKEGFSPRASWDHKQWSIGYGTKSTEGEVITEREADKRMREVLQKSQDAVLAHARKNNYDFNQNQVDALTSFVYNLGPGILNQLTGKGSRSIEEIAAKIPEYNKASGKIEPGLQKRRAEEYAMFTSPGSSTGAALASASTASSDLNRASSTQPPPQVNVDARQTNNNVAGGKAPSAPVASATNVDAPELFFKYAM